MQRKILILVVCFIGIITSCSKKHTNIENLKFKSYPLDAVNSNVKIYLNRDSIISNTEFLQNKILVIFDNKSFFIEKAEDVLDTLNKTHEFFIIEDVDALKHYTNNVKVEKLILIE